MGLNLYSQKNSLVSRPSFPKGEERAQTFVIPGVYPSLNRWSRKNYYVANRNKQDYIEEIQFELISQKAMGYLCPIELLIELRFGTRRKRDSDNFAPKWLKDALKGFVIPDDDTYWIPEERVRFLPCQKPELTRITLTPYELEK